MRTLSLEPRFVAPSGAPSKAPVAVSACVPPHPPQRSVASSGAPRKAPVAAPPHCGTLHTLRGPTVVSA
eukprot:4948025-Pyramimonas_sp.AAC.1